MEIQFAPEILEVAEPLTHEEIKAPAAEEVEISYSCGRCPPTPPDKPVRW